MEKYRLNISKLENYIGKTFDTDVSLVGEIANYLKTTNYSLVNVYYKCNKIYVEQYVMNLIGMLNNSNIDVTLEELINSEVLEKENE